MNPNDADLEVGRLVRWINGGYLGVIEEIDRNRIKVAWDEDYLSPLLARRDAPIEPVEIPQRVRRRSNGEMGFVLEPAPNAQRPSWKVILPDRGGAVRVIPESDLRPDHPEGPVGRLLAGSPPGSARETNITTATLYMVNEHFNNDLVSLDASRVDVKPHQVGVVHRVVSNYPHRYLLCDEVGLGKTIEAGLVLKELRSRGLVDRVLVVVPPNLRRQWQFELKTKFNETFSILDSNTVRYLKNQGNEGNPFAKYDSVIVSDAWVSGDPWRKMVTECAWDMVIVDEAHHARSKKAGSKTTTTQLYSLVKQLIDRSAYPDRAALLLTATPMQLDSHELYSLIEMLDEALFPSEEHFDEHRSRLPGLSLAVEELRRLPKDSEPPDDLVSRVAGWLDAEPIEVIRRIRKEGVQRLCEDLSSRHLLSEILIRNRKAVVGGFMPRHAHRWQVELTEAERDALDRVEDYVSRGYTAMTEQNDQSIGFLMVGYQKMMASSIAALRTSLAKRRDRLEHGEATARMSTKELRQLAAETDDDSDVLTDAAVRLAELNSEEAEELTTLVAMLDAVPVDSKAEEFRKQLRILREEAVIPKVLVFTQFRATQDHLADLLHEDGWRVSQFHGQMTAQAKDDAVERFRDDPGAHVLVSTEAGGEGRNFQFCHLLVNYDLPWNPMRVEQRIGRVDRIGQQHVVEIFNFWVKDSVEERVLEVLERRINVFEQTVGGLDPILGEAEKSIRDIMMKNRSDRIAALENLGLRLEEQVAAARSAEEQLRDLIMDTRSFSREIAERIAGQKSPITAEMQETFMTRLLAAVRTYIKKQTGEYQLRFHEPFLSDHKDLFPDGPQRRGVFRPDERTDSQLVEFMALGHPIIDACIEEVTDPHWSGAAGGRVLECGSDIDPCRGWLFLFDINVPDLRSRTELVPVFVHDHGELSEDIGRTLVLRTLTDTKERSISTDGVMLETLETANDLAEEHIGGRVVAFEAAARATVRERVEREKTRMAVYYDYRMTAANDRLAATTATVERLRASGEEGDRRILPVWESRLADDERRISALDEERHRRLIDLDRRAELPADYQLVQAVRVEVLERPDVG